MSNHWMNLQVSSICHCHVKIYKVHRFSFQIQLDLNELTKYANSSILWKQLNRYNGFCYRTKSTFPIELNLRKYLPKSKSICYNWDQCELNKSNVLLFPLEFRRFHSHRDTILQYRPAFVHKEYVSNEHENIEQHDCNTNNSVDIDSDTKRHTYRFHSLNKKKNPIRFILIDDKFNVQSQTKSSSVKLTI